MKNLIFILLFLPFFSQSQNMEVLWNSEVESSDGKVVKLREFKGEVIYIDLWASWCLPCRWEFPKFERLAEEYKEKPIHFIGLSVDYDQAKWLRFLKRKEPEIPEYRFLYESEKVFSKEFEVNGIPHFILIRKDGTLYQNNTFRPSDALIGEVLDKMLE